MFKEIELGLITITLDGITKTLFPMLPPHKIYEVSVYRMLVTIEFCGFVCIHVLPVVVRFVDK